MSEQYQSDFEIGYNYARKRHLLLAKHSPRNILELGRAYLLVKGSTIELSRGMGIYYLQLGVKMLLAEPERQRYPGKVTTIHNG